MLEETRNVTQYSSSCKHSQGTSGPNPLVPSADCPSHPRLDPYRPRTDLGLLLSRLYYFCFFVWRHDPKSQSYRGVHSWVHALVVIILSCQLLSMAWSLGRLVGWLIDRRSIAWLTDLIAWLIDRLIAWLIGWLFNWLVCYWRSRLRGDFRCFFNILSSALCF